MPTFPTNASGSVRAVAPLADEAMAMYPATIAIEQKVKVFTFLNDEEQRFVSSHPLLRITLKYTLVNGYDMSVIRDFFMSMRGAHVTSLLIDLFDITLEGVEYNYCCFDQDELTVEVGPSETYSFELKIRQLRAND